MKYKNGFTLAELLITLAIVTIITIMMVQTLFYNKPNKEQLMIKKVYTETSNIIMQMVNNTELYDNNNSSGEANFANTGQVTYKNQTFGGAPGSAQARAKFCNIFKLYLNVVQTNKDCSLEATLDEGGHFVTADGVVWVMPITEFNGNANQTYEILVDVTSKGSSNNNCTTEDNIDGCNTPDRFKILLNRNGAIDVPPKDKILRYYLNHTSFNKTFKDIKKEADKMPIYEN